jgi:hypothetical protein
MRLIHDNSSISNPQQQKVFLNVLINIILITIVTTILSALNKFFLLGYLRSVYLLSFLILGIFELIFIEKLLLSLSLKAKLLIIALLSTIIVGVLLFLVRDAKYNVNLYLISCCAFLLPSILYHSWLFYNAMLNNEYKTWYIINTNEEERLSIFLNSLSINFRLFPSPLGAVETFFLTLPAYVPLGRLFNQFVITNNRNEGTLIEWMDEDKNIYGWIFYIKEYSGTSVRYLDPEKTLRENNIKDNAIIIAERKIK